eukprot:6837151-Alexandrium_andersonii.AAC.1
MAPSSRSGPCRSRNAIRSSVKAPRGLRGVVLRRSSGALWACSSLGSSVSRATAAWSRASPPRTSPEGRNPHLQSSPGGRVHYPEVRNPSPVQTELEALQSFPEVRNPDRGHVEAR